MTSELKPCPFCGGDATIHEPVPPNFWFVCCSNGDTCGTCGPDRKTKAEAIKAWNTRAERTCKGCDTDPDWCCECSRNYADLYFASKEVE